MTDARVKKETPPAQRRKKSTPADLKTAPDVLSAADLEYKTALRHPAVEIALRQLSYAQARWDSDHRALCAGAKSVTVEDLADSEARIGDVQKSLVEIADRMPVLARHPLFSTAISQELMRSKELALFHSTQEKEKMENLTSKTDAEISGQKIVFYFDVHQPKTQELIDGFNSTTKTLFGRTEHPVFKGGVIDSWLVPPLAPVQLSWAFEMASDEEIDDADASAFHAVVLEHLKDNLSVDVTLREAVRTTTFEKSEPFLTSPTASSKPRM